MHFKHQQITTNSQQSSVSHKSSSVLNIQRHRSPNTICPAHKEAFMCSLKVFPLIHLSPVLKLSLPISAASTRKSIRRKTEGKLRWQNTRLPTVDGGLVVSVVGFQKKLNVCRFFAL